MINKYKVLQKVRKKAAECIPELLGLCSVAHVLYKLNQLNLEEYRWFRDYVLDAPDVQFPGSAYKWYPAHALKPRLEWLDKHIEWHRPLEHLSPFRRFLNKFKIKRNEKE